MEAPNFWPEFEALANVPLWEFAAPIRIFYRLEVFHRNGARHPNFISLTVEGQGHAPLLLDQSTIDAIVEFIGRCP